MRITRHRWDGLEPGPIVAQLRALQPAPNEATGDVAELIEEVRRRGDLGVMELERRFGGEPPVALRVPDEEVYAARAAVPEDVANAIELAADNIRRVAEADAETSGAAEVRLDQGQTVSLRDVPVGAAGAYVPGGTAAYPSTALMCCIPAKVAGVERVAVASPPGEDGHISPVVLAAAAIAGADEVFAMGGVQAIAALALGTESVQPVDLVCGPGNRFVQEAKRQLSGQVGIDSLAGPSELMVIFDDEADLGWLALDLCAQAEHGRDGLLVALSASEARLDALEAEVASLADVSETVGDAPLGLIQASSAASAVDFANALAPEHLELAVRGAEELAASVRTAGCTLVGPFGATAFGDYAAGSDHVLPTGGSGRFTGPLGPGTFRRRLATVEIGREAARKLAPAAATLARAEGFPVHGASVIARTRHDGRRGEG